MVIDHDWSCTGPKHHSRSTEAKLRPLGRSSEKFYLIDGTGQVFRFHRFDVYSPDHVNRQEDEVGLHRAASMLNGLIEEEHHKHGIPYARIFIGGISQGGAVSLLTAVTTLHPIGGVFALSSYITLRKKIPEVQIHTIAFAKDVH